MIARSLLYDRLWPVNDSISVVNPDVGEVLEQEDDYYSIVSLITATPYDMMVQLDDMKLDCRDMDDYELFLLMFEMLKLRDTSLVFGELDLRSFSPAVNPQNNMVVLRNSETGAVIDKNIHALICQTLRRMHHLTRNHRKPANDEALRLSIAVTPKADI